MLLHCWLLLRHLLHLSHLLLRLLWNLLHLHSLWHLLLLHLLQLLLLLRLRCCCSNTLSHLWRLLLWCLMRCGLEVRSHIGWGYLGCLLRSW